ncbi:MAG: hypothetical protein VB133_08655 [Anaeromusa sp.]|uniref:hypothetical protein n=1 Tax=Anaeromusa sp. TaxID=1872520 RepID=UPI002B1FA569|nr:hypothetical protein [Anaeromusa sp.]MEA4835191.1 hypothetical protein [Anaeromusa sp.]
MTLAANVGISEGCCDVATITHRWPLTTDATDVVAGLATTNLGGVTFSSAGALFTGTNTKALTFTKALSASYSFSFWAKSGGTQTNYWTPFMSSDAGSNAGTGICSCGALDGLNAATNWTSGMSGRLVIESKASKFIDGSEHLHIMTFSGSAITYKMDADATLSGAATLAPTNFNFAIGRWGMYVTQNLAWNGTVRDLRIYDGQVLTEEDMSAIYTAGPNGSSGTAPKPQASTGGL